MEETCKPLFSFGVIADVQYGDKDDNHSEGRVQRYREAPQKLDKAVETFNASKSSLLFVLTLGDIIDGNDTVERTSADFDIVLTSLSMLELPTYHLLGNHCLTLPRERMLQDLQMPDRFYHAELHPGWALVILDTMDISVKWPVGSKNHEEAMTFMHNHPLGEANPQMSEWNGGLGSEQKTWLAHILSDAERQGTHLIVAGHHPLVVGSAPSTHLLWNHEEVAKMLVESPAVALFLNGHYHPGGYAQVGAKHFVTVEAILEAPTGSFAHGIIHVYEKEIEIQGFSTVTSRVLSIE
ncbi:unnamed protein product [Sphagnum troendelagicum]|uniref:Calcineurin-like phosphoesterase domain-containing protein n=1 Tax=Sphagnum troendelagicum TaxID=128251 RepID=A0ABP0TI45_9BRYO